MICPECGRELEKGIIEAKDAGSLTQSLTMVCWYPEEYKKQNVQKEYRKSKIEGGRLLL